MFEALFDVQCFDLKAVESIGRNQKHVEMTAGMYANPFNCGSVVNRLDCAILSATEIDVNFNVNVNTESMATCCTIPADIATWRPVPRFRSSFARRFADGCR